MILIGYSQGAFAALGVGYEHPEHVVGTIAVSPGSMTNPPLTTKPGLSLKGRGFVLVHGTKDRPEWVRQGRTRIEAAKAAGATTEVKVYPNAGHLVPDDLPDILVDWTAMIRRVNGS